MDELRIREGKLDRDRGLNGAKLINYIQCGMDVIKGVADQAIH